MKTIGPGVIPFMNSTPMAMAVTESPGIPNTRAGIQVPPSAALFDAPAAARPSSCPVPNFSGVREKLLAMA